MILNFSSEEDDSPVKVQNYHTEFNTSKKKRSKSLKHQKIGASSKEKIMLVDDEIFNILVLESFCKYFRLPTEKAFNGKEAIEKILRLKEEGTVVRIVLLDVNMPVMDGYETSKALNAMVEKGELDEIVIIGITAYVAPDMIAKCYKAGFTKVLNKPVSKEALRTALKDYKVVI